MTIPKSPDEWTIKQFIAVSDSGNAYTAEQMTFLSALVDHFEGGNRALEQRLYPEAATRFRDFLTTATERHSTLDGEVERQLKAKRSEGHLLAAVALLGGGSIGTRSPQTIAQVDNHLEHARAEGASSETFHQASVLWAIVKEDSTIDGMFVRPPLPAELRGSLGQLNAAKLAFLGKHIQLARGETFAALQQAAGVQTTPATPLSPTPIDAGRQKAVANYFTRPIGAIEVMWALLAFFGLVMIVVGISDSICLVVLGLGMIVLPVVKSARYWLAYPKPTHQQMDTWLTRDIQQTVMPRALAHLRIDSRPSHEGGDLLVPAQVVVGVANPGIVLQVMKTLHFYRIGIGGDGKVRASYYYVLILFMTDKIVSAYVALLETATGQVKMDATQEHRYGDIAGVHTRTVPMNIAPELRQHIAQETLSNLSAEHEFSLSIVSGDSLKVTVGFTTQAAGASGGIAWGNEQSLAMIQRMIRGKKES